MSPNPGARGQEEEAAAEELAAAEENVAAVVVVRQVRGSCLALETGCVRSAGTTNLPATYDAVNAASPFLRKEAEGVAAEEEGGAAPVAAGVVGTTVDDAATATITTIAAAAVAAGRSEGVTVKGAKMRIRRIVATRKPRARKRRRRAVDVGSARQATASAAAVPKAAPRAVMTMLPRAARSFLAAAATRVHREWCYCLRLSAWTAHHVNGRLVLKEHKLCQYF